jgi:hypothetical protein
MTKGRDAGQFLTKKASIELQLMSDQKSVHLSQPSAVVEKAPQCLIDRHTLVPHACVRGKHEAKLATLEIMVRTICTRKIWPLASPRVLPKSLPNP